MIFIYNVYYTMRHAPKVEMDDPWGYGASLEWATSCPPPRHNFVELPRIRSERPAFDLHHPEYAYVDLPPKRTAVLEWREHPMKIEGWLFGFGAVIFLVAAAAYGFFTKDWTIGFPLLLFTGLLALIVGYYVLFTSKRVYRGRRTGGMARSTRQSRSTASTARIPGGR